MNSLKSTAKKIAVASINQLKPELLLKNIFKQIEFPDQVHLLAVGKAAWAMAKTAKEQLGNKIWNGSILTNYGNSSGNIEGLEIFEAGHPLPDDNSVKFTDKILKKISNLSPKDHLLMLISGGGSALLEKPLESVTLSDLRSITQKMLKSGADIDELNIVRKHLSAVKGGRFAKLVPCNITAYIISDVMGDDPATIASGPVSAHKNNPEKVLEILKKYDITLSENLKKAVNQATPGIIDNVEVTISGNNKLLCETAAKLAENEGFNSFLYPLHLKGEAKQMGEKIAAIARRIKLQNDPVSSPCAVIFGGETTVKVTGNGIGGRNQEMLLGAAAGIAGLQDIVILAIASDGIDGPTEAAGGIVDGYSQKRIEAGGRSLNQILAENDSFTALMKINSLIITGQTGTNVNDLAIILVK
ncbi:MAG: hypothetical protein APR54_09275 [Candidatus Cloacimonas sp. SDB]|nr:MAG: hypothetical protein APR54_09275 [Candidatus Cloacimonas sp. SDB]